MELKYELLRSIAYSSRPLRWKLRKLLQKEKERLESSIPKLEKQGVNGELLKKNKEIMEMLDHLTETFRPALIHNHPLEELKQENKKAVKK
jgi:hypothetical protein